MLNTFTNSIDFLYISYKIINEYVSKYKKKCGEKNVRVISGSARGKKLSSVEGLDVRPTLDRVKESIFNMIAFDILGADVLDLFCGSGALGIEALSRGAEKCVFVDKNEQSLSCTKQNLLETHLLGQAQVVKSDSVLFLNCTDKKFDIILIDPPYKSNLYDEVLSLILERKLLKENGKIVIEAGTDDVPEVPKELFSEVREKKYGKVYILVIKA